MNLADQIAREHSRVTAAGVCLCGAEGIGFEVGYAAHIAAATEQAVRERVADESMLREVYRAALRRLGTDPDELDAAFREGVMEAIRRVRGDADV